MSCVLPGAARVRNNLMPMGLYSGADVCTCMCMFVSLCVGVIRNNHNQRKLQMRAGPIRVWVKEGLSYAELKMRSKVSG